LHCPKQILYDYLLDHEDELLNKGILSLSINDINENTINIKAFVSGSHVTASTIRTAIALDNAKLGNIDIVTTSLADVGFKITTNTVGTGTVVILSGKRFVLTAAHVLTMLDSDDHGVGTWIGAAPGVYRRTTRHRLPTEVTFTSEESTKSVITCDTANVQKISVQQVETTITLDNPAAVVLCGKTDVVAFDVEKFFGNDAFPQKYTLVEIEELTPGTDYDKDCNVYKHGIATQRTSGILTGIGLLHATTVKVSPGDSGSLLRFADGDKQGKVIGIIVKGDDKSSIVIPISKFYADLESAFGL